MINPRCPKHNIENSAAPCCCKADVTALHDYEVLLNEEETGLKVSRLKVPNGWIYTFSYPLGLNTVFVKEAIFKNECS